MAVRSGIGGQIGFAPEVTYGTYVAPSKFVEGTSTLKDDSQYVIPTAVAAGRFQPLGSRRVKVGFGASGNLEMPVYSLKMGLLLQALMGTTVTPVIIGAGPGYTQTHTLADPFGKSLTVQAGVPDVSTGTANDFSFLGCKVLSAEFKCAVGEILTSTWEIDSREMTEAQTLAAASYSASNVFHFANAEFKIGATVGAAAHIEGVTGVSAKITRASKTDRNYMGNLGKKSEAIINENDENVIAGTIDADFVAKADLVDRWHAGTAFSMVWEFVGAAFTGGNETFRLTLPQCYLTGDTPTMEGPDVVSTSFPFITTLDASATQPFITYMSQEAAI